MLPNKPFVLIEAEILRYVSERHSNQPYGDEKDEHGEFPYHVHLYQAANVARKYGFSNAVYFALLGHDLLEDTFVSYNNVKKLMGEEAADIVYDVTDGKGKNRKEKHRHTYPEIRKNPRAIEAKLCDRIANVSFGLATLNYDKMTMYVKEHDEFVEALMIEGHADEAWKDLRELSLNAKSLIVVENARIGYKKYKF